MKNPEQKGSIIIYTILIMTTITMISIYLMRILLPKLRTTNEAVNSTIAFYAADSGMEWCIFANRDDSTQLPAVPTQPVSLKVITGAAIQYYSGNNSTSCPSGAAINFRTVGTYQGISRSLEIF